MRAFLAGGRLLGFHPENRSLARRQLCSAAILGSRRLRDTGSRQAPRVLARVPISRASLREAGPHRGSLSGTGLSPVIPVNVCNRQPSLDEPRLSRYHSSSLLYGADLGFHAEWLRDEPYEATTTGSEFIFWSPGVNSRPTQGEHEIRGAEFPASRSSFPHSLGKEDFAFRALFQDGSSRCYSKASSS